KVNLWIKNMESIVHLTKTLSEKLNDDFLSVEWVIHRINRMNGKIENITEKEESLIRKYLSYQVSSVLIQAISAIIFRNPNKIYEIWKQFTKKSCLVTYQHKLKLSTGLPIETPIKEFGDKVLKKLKELESALLFDKRFAELWDENAMPPRMLRPYYVVNDIDKDDIPYLEFVAENLFNIKVIEPDTTYNYGCSCEDNCKNNCACIDDHMEGGYPYQNKRLIHSDVGILYECNSKCSCNSNCRNRIIQNSPKLNRTLQIFKTNNKGWGVQTLENIKRGGFVTEHMGEVIDSKTALTRTICYNKLHIMPFFDLDYDLKSQRIAFFASAGSVYITLL
ncbi:4162_t:CDS:10, partial [Entrophospora sp. SA101]